MNRMTLDREGGKPFAAARSAVAAALVMGLAALVWVHIDFETGVTTHAAQVLGTAPGCAADDCLHVPAGDPSVPAAESVFVAGGASPADVPPVPTF